MPFVVELKEPGTQTFQTSVQYPIRTVPGSERVRVTVIGKLLTVN